MKLSRTLALGATSLALVATSAIGASAQGPTVRIGSDNFYESKLVAEIYAQVLEGQGWTVDRQLGLGSRAERNPIFQGGQVDLVPERRQGPDTMEFAERCAARLEERLRRDHQDAHSLLIFARIRSKLLRRYLLHG